MHKQYLPKAGDRAGKSAHVIEENGEVITTALAVNDAIAKIVRFGHDSRYPDDAPTNTEKLVAALKRHREELGDALAATEALLVEYP